MQIYRGDRRLFDTVVEEDGSSTSTNRIIPVPGVTRLEEILNCIIPVKAYISGVSNTTYIQINNLERKELKLFYGNNNPSSPNHSWVKPGQIFNILYNGDYFTITGISLDDVKGTYNFGFLNNSPVTGMDLTTYLTSTDFNSIKIGDTMYVYYDTKAANIYSTILSTITWTNTYAVGKSCSVKTIAFLDYACNPVSIDICLGSNGIVYYGNTPGYDVT